MAKSLNEVNLIGNVGSVEPQQTKGMSVTRISVATSYSKKDKDNEWQDITEWHRVVLFDKLADIAEKYVQKGNKVFIKGQLKTDKYTDKDGIERHSTNIVAREIILLTPKNGGETKDEYKSAPATKQDYSKIKAPENDFIDDDIPF